MKRISLLILSLLFFATAFQSDKIMTSGWYQQFFPNLNGSTIKDITFLDSLTGFAVTTTTSSQSYILKTTNCGDNWNINYTSNSTWSFIRIISIDSNTIFAVKSYTEIFKTTNRGNNWETIPLNIFCNDIAIINKDTMIAVNSSGFDGGVYRSTNCGLNWSLIWTNGSSGNPDKIYMYDKNMGFSCNISTSSSFRKTTNGGINWIDNTTDYFLSIKFIDTLTGWKGNGTSIKKTTDGGITWISQTPPNVIGFNVYSISTLNKDTVWLGGGSYKIIGSTFYGVLSKTTNGGANWGYQIPNMAIDSGIYLNVNFVNKNCGWAYVNDWGINDGIHTKVGGNDSIFFTGIKLVPDIVPERFSLGQNYPNPFNPATNIPFELKEPSQVTLKVFDARGREVKELVNGRWGTGKFIADFDASALATGIYFYQIIVSGESTHQMFTATRKMMLIK
jgi:photosystem II stability/assembly factor-like uncharacterized protein